MGFSLTGLLIALAVLAPSIVLVILPPLDGKVPAAGGPIFTVLERAGQIACLTVLAASSANFDGIAPNLWFVLMAGYLVAYYGLWVRYIVRGRRLMALFGPLGFIPIPLAIFPVLVFAFASAWGESIWLLLATAVLAIGHLTTSWRTYRAISSD